MGDAPNERSLHRTVIPRFGGLGILLGTGIGLALAGEPVPSFWLLAAYVALALVSALDDRRSIAAPVRLAVHLLAAAAWTVTLGLPFVWSALIVAGLVWSANLFNFMDGADGLAGVMAVIGLAALGWVAAQAGGAEGYAIARACFVLSAAVMGFLVFNFPPARLFLGDSGSIPLGFVAGALGVQGTLAGLWSPLFPLIVFFPFVFDATFTLARRLARGRSALQAHREHLYQRAILAGLSHRQMTLRACAMMLAGAAAAIAVRDFPYWTHFLIIGLQAVIGAVLSVRIARNDAMEGEKA